MTTVKTSGAEAHVLTSWTKRFFASMQLSLQRSQLALLTETALTTFHLLLPLVLLWLGTQAVVHGTMTIGSMLGLTLLAAACLSPLYGLIDDVQHMQMVRSHLDRLLDVWQTPTEQPAPPQRVASLPP